MPTFSAAPMEAYAWADPHIDLENPHFVISVEWTWPSGDWSHFCLVRSIRSPARRREEGQVMIETTKEGWPNVAVASGLPVFRDPQPPGGDWVFYTAFCLDPNRVWTYAGTVYEIGIADYDWTLRLPESLPGVAIADRQQTLAPAERGHDLVQFFQSPGAFLDRAVTMAEATQFFWDPLRCPPQMLQAMMESIGYEFDSTLGIGRLRHVLDALMKPQQGSLRFIDGFVHGATGYESAISISNNLMINASDSSFEDGDLGNWEVTGGAGAQVRLFEDWLDPTPVLPPNVKYRYFAYIDGAATLLCGNSDPVAHGIPCATWTKARMGCYAHDNADPEHDVTLSMGLKLYDWEGTFLRDVEILPAQTLTVMWAWYGSADESAVDLGTQDFAYAVPYITVSDACSIDLIVVDDGK